MQINWHPLSKEQKNRRAERQLELGDACALENLLYQHTRAYTHMHTHARTQTEDTGII